MKNSFLFFISIIFFVSCARRKQIVNTHFIDSVIVHYSIPAIAKENDEEMQFWKSRINPARPGMVNEAKYAACLHSRFRFFGDIDDLEKADSIIRKINTDFSYKEASADLSLAGYCITEHRFTVADSFFEKAKQLGIRPYESLASSFDIYFELGRYAEAKTALNALRSPNDYGYFFRKSKMEHLNGELDSSVSAMLKAASFNDGNDYLKEVALANAADLYIHEGELQKAKDLYEESIILNSADFHSITGLGWIALVHDKNYLLAEEIFSFVKEKNKLPDALFKLCQLNQAKGDSATAKKWAEEFAAKANSPVFGNMYNKYLVQLYTGILNNPGIAEKIAYQELANRAIPQTFAWYAWTLICNNKKDEACKIFQQHVSGKPLEALELYWMGKLMLLMGKGYNANEFFKAAYKNKFDLDPAMVKDIEKNLE